MKILYKYYFIRKITAMMILIAFFFTLIVPVNQVRAQGVPVIPTGTVFLPLPGTVISLSPQYTPILLKGIAVDPQEPLTFEFILDKGQEQSNDEQLQHQAQKLIRYFLTSLTVPDEKLWVNLSPVEKDRIMADGLAQTDMGRDLLSEDYLLKQLTASLMSPENDLGREFWDELYTSLPAEALRDEALNDLFHKIWIVPDKAVVYEKDNKAFVLEGRLKVLLEEDYLASGGKRLDDSQELKSRPYTLTSQILRRIIVPAVEKEVNEGKSFSSLRQMYHSIILSVWFKQRLQQHLLNAVYSGKNLIEGIDTSDQTVREKVYQQYLESLRVGVCNLIKEEYDPESREIIPRKYFTGGTNFDPTKGILDVKTDPAVEDQMSFDNAMAVKVELQANQDVQKSLEGIFAEREAAIRKIYKANPDEYEALVAFLKKEADLLSEDLESVIEMTRGLDDVKSLAVRFGVDRKTIKNIMDARHLSYHRIYISGRKFIDLLYPFELNSLKQKRREILAQVQSNYQRLFNEEIELDEDQPFREWVKKKDLKTIFPIIGAGMINLGMASIFCQIQDTNLGFDPIVQYIPPIEMDRLKSKVVNGFREPQRFRMLLKYGLISDSLTPDTLTFDIVANALNHIQENKDEWKTPVQMAESNELPFQHYFRLARLRLVDVIDLNLFGNKRKQYFPLQKPVLDINVYEEGASEDMPASVRNQEDFIDSEDFMEINLAPPQSSESIVFDAQVVEKRKPVTPKQAESTQKRASKKLDPPSKKEQKVSKENPIGDFVKIFEELAEKKFLQMPRDRLGIVYELMGIDRTGFAARDQKSYRQVMEEYGIKLNSLLVLNSMFLDLIDQVSDKLKLPEAKEKELFSLLDINPFNPTTLRSKEEIEEIFSFVMDGKVKPKASPKVPMSIEDIYAEREAGIRNIYKNNPDEYKEFVEFLKNEAGLVSEDLESVIAMSEELDDVQSLAVRFGVSQIIIKKMMEARQLSYQRINTIHRKFLDFLYPSELNALKQQRQKILREVESNYQRVFKQKIILDEDQPFGDWVKKTDLMTIFPALGYDFWANRLKFIFCKIQDPDLGFYTNAQYVPPIEVKRLEEYVVNQMQEPARFSMLLKYGLLPENFLPSQLNFQIVSEVINRILSEWKTTKQMQEINGLSSQYYHQQAEERLMDAINLNLFGVRSQYYFPDQKPVLKMNVYTIESEAMSAIVQKQETVIVPVDFVERNLALKPNIITELIRFFEYLKEKEYPDVNKKDITLIYELMGINQFVFEAQDQKSYDEVMRFYRESFTSLQILKMRYVDLINRATALMGLSENKQQEIISLLDQPRLLTGEEVAEVFDFAMAVKVELQANQDVQKSLEGIFAEREAAIRKIYEDDYDEFGYLFEFLEKNNVGLLPEDLESVIAASEELEDVKSLALRLGVSITTMKKIINKLNLPYHRIYVNKGKFFDLIHPDAIKHLQEKRREILTQVESSYKELFQQEIELDQNQPFRDWVKKKDLSTIFPFVGGGILDLKMVFIYCQIQDNDLGFDTHVQYIPPIEIERLQSIVLNRLREPSQFRMLVKYELIDSSLTPDKLKFDIATKILERIQSEWKTPAQMAELYGSSAEYYRRKVQGKSMDAIDLNFFGKTSNYYFPNQEPALEMDVYKSSSEEMPLSYNKNQKYSIPEDFAERNLAPQMSLESNVYSPEVVEKRMKETKSKVVKEEGKDIKAPSKKRQEVSGKIPVADFIQLFEELAENQYPQMSRERLRIVYELMGIDRSGLSAQDQKSYKKVRELVDMKIGSLLVLNSAFLDLITQVSEELALSEEKEKELFSLLEINPFKPTPLHSKEEIEEIFDFAMAVEVESKANQDELPLMNLTRYADSLKTDVDTVKRMLKHHAIETYEVPTGNGIVLISPKGIKKIDAMRKAVLKEAESLHNQHFANKEDQVHLETMDDLMSWSRASDIFQKFGFVANEQQIEKSTQFWSYRVEQPHIGLTNKARFIPPAEVKSLEQRTIAIVTRKQNWKIFRQAGLIPKDMTPKEMTFDAANKILTQVAHGDNWINLNDVEKKVGVKRNTVYGKIKKGQVAFVEINLFGRNPRYFLPEKQVYLFNKALTDDMHAAKAFLENKCLVDVPSYASIEDLLESHAMTEKQFVEFLGVEKIPGFKNLEETQTHKIGNKNATVYISYPDAVRLKAIEEEKFAYLNQEMMERFNVHGFETPRDLFQYLEQNYETSKELIERGDYPDQNAVGHAIRDGNLRSIHFNLMGFGFKDRRYFLSPDLAAVETMIKKREAIETLFLAVFDKQIFYNQRGITQEGFLYGARALDLYCKHLQFIKDTGIDPSNQMLDPSVNAELLFDDLLNRLILILSTQEKLHLKNIVDRLTDLLKDAEKYMKGITQNPNVQERAQLRQFDALIKKLFDFFQAMNVIYYKFSGTERLTNTDLVALNKALKANSALMFPESLQKGIWLTVIASKLLNNDQGTNRTVIITDRLKFKVWEENMKMLGIKNYVFLHGLSMSQDESWLKHIQDQNIKYVFFDRSGLSMASDQIRDLPSDLITIDLFNDMELDASGFNFSDPMKDKHRIVLAKPAQFSRRFEETVSLLSWISGWNMETYLDAKKASPNNQVLDYFYSSFVRGKANQLVLDANPRIDLSQKQGQNFKEELLSSITELFPADAVQDHFDLEKAMVGESDAFRSKEAKDFKEKMNALTPRPDEWAEVLAEVPMKSEGEFYTPEEIRKLLVLLQDKSNRIALSLLQENFKGRMYKRINRYIEKLNLKFGDEKISEHTQDIERETEDYLSRGLFAFDPNRTNDVFYFIFGNYERHMDRIVRDLLGNYHIPENADRDRKEIVRLYYLILAKLNIKVSTYDEFCAAVKQLPGETPFEEKFDRDQYHSFVSAYLTRNVELDGDVKQKNDKGGKASKHGDMMSQEKIVPDQESAFEDWDRRKIFQGIFDELLSTESIKNGKGEYLRNVAILSHVLGYNYEDNLVVNPRQRTDIAKSLPMTFEKVSSERVTQIATSFIPQIIEIMSQNGNTDTEISHVLSLLGSNKVVKKQLEGIAAAASNQRANLRARRSEVLKASNPEDYAMATTFTDEQLGRFIDQFLNSFDASANSGNSYTNKRMLKIQLEMMGIDWLRRKFKDQVSYDELESRYPDLSNLIRLFSVKDRKKKVECFENMGLFQGDVNLLFDLFNLDHPLNEDEVRAVFTKAALKPKNVQEIDVDMNYTFRLRSAIQKLNDAEYQKLKEFLELHRNVKIPSISKMYLYAKQLHTYSSYARHINVDKNSVKEIVKRHNIPVFQFEGENNFVLIAPKGIALIEKKRKGVFEDLKKQYLAQFGEGTLFEPESLDDLIFWTRTSELTKMFPSIPPDTFEKRTGFWSYSIQVPDIGLNVGSAYVPPQEIRRMKEKVVSMVIEDNNFEIFKRYYLIDPSKTKEQVTFEDALNVLQRVNEDVFWKRPPEVASEMGVTRDGLKSMIRKNEIEYVNINVFSSSAKYFIPIGQISEWEEESGNPFELNQKRELREIRGFLRDECDVKLTRRSNLALLVNENAMDKDQFIAYLGMDSYPSFNKLESTRLLRVDPDAQARYYMARKQADRILSEENAKFSVLNDQMQSVYGLGPFSTRKEMVDYLKANFDQSKDLIAQGRYQSQNEIRSAIFKGELKPVVCDLIGFGFRAPGRFFPREDEDFAMATTFTDAQLGVFIQRFLRLANNQKDSLTDLNSERSLKILLEVMGIDWKRRKFTNQESYQEIGLRYSEVSELVGFFVQKNRKNILTYFEKVGLFFGDVNLFLALFNPEKRLNEDEVRAVFTKAALKPKDVHHVDISEKYDIRLRSLIHRIDSAQFQKLQTFLESETGAVSPSREEMFEIVKNLHTYASYARHINNSTRNTQRIVQRYNVPVFKFEGNDNIVLISPKGIDLIEAKRQEVFDDLKKQYVAQYGEGTLFEPESLDDLSFWTRTTELAEIFPYIPPSVFEKISGFWSYKIPIEDAGFRLGTSYFPPQEIRKMKEKVVRMVTEENNFEIFKRYNLIDQSKTKARVTFEDALNVLERARGDVFWVRSSEELASQLGVTYDVLEGMLQRNEIEHVNINVFSSFAVYFIPAEQINEWQALKLTPMEENRSQELLAVTKFLSEECEVKDPQKSDLTLLMQEKALDKKQFITHLDIDAYPSFDKLESTHLLRVEMNDQSRYYMARKSADKILEEEQEKFRILNEQLAAEYGIGPFVTRREMVNYLKANFDQAKDLIAQGRYQSNNAIQWAISKKKIKSVVCDFIGFRFPHPARFFPRTNEDAALATKKEVGGIDLSHNQIDLQIDSDNISFATDYDLSQFEGLTGFTPVIVEWLPSVSPQQIWGP